MLARFLSWYGTKQASTWIFALAIAVVSGMVARDYSMQAKIAKCRANQEQAQRFEDVAGRLARELEIDRDAAIEQIENAVDDCLDRDIDELLNP